MANVLLAWELGAGYGHIAPLRLLAQWLRGHGHRCAFALRDLAKAEGYLDPALGPVLQAPLREGRGRRPVKTQVSYASLLNNIGFDEERGLAARVRAWREIMLAARCELVYAHHAPTALLAAQALGLPAVTLGSGFMLPPQQRPFPAWDTGTPVTAEILARNEQAVLGRLNAALRRLGTRPLDDLQQLFAGVERGLLSYRELDHYEQRSGEVYLGLPEMALGARPLWPQQRAPRLFAYLRPFKGLPALLEALQRSRAHVLVRVGDIAASRLRGYERVNMVITDQAVHLGQAAESCDAYINYAAHGSVAEMLLAGRAGLLIPNTVERSLLARRAVALGAAISLPHEQGEHYAAAIERVIEDTSLRAAARHFADRHAAQDRGAIIPSIAALGLSRVRGGSAAA